MCKCKLWGNLLPTQHLPLQSDRNDFVERLLVIGKAVYDLKLKPYCIYWRWFRALIKPNRSNLRRLCADNI